MITGEEDAVSGDAPRLPIIGLLGGIASGKSAVAKMLEAKGAGVLDADRAGHEVLQDPEVIQAARVRWGDGVLAEDGSIDRAAVAAIVFGDSANAAEERRYLESVTHPRIGARLQAQIESWVRDGGVTAIVLDAPLLLEAGWEDACAAIVYVDARPEVREARAVARGWTKEEFAARERTQAALDAKRNSADVVLNNSGTLAELQAEVDTFWADLTASKG